MGFVSDLGLWMDLMILVLDSVRCYSDGGLRRVGRFGLGKGS